MIMFKCFNLTQNYFEKLNEILIKKKSHVNAQFEFHFSNKFVYVLNPVKFDENQKSTMQKIIRQLNHAIEYKWNENMGKDTFTWRHEEARAIENLKAFFKKKINETD